jgi:uroporphyrinogen decarboxylase
LPQSLRTPFDPVRSTADLAPLDAGKTPEKFAIVAETVARVRQDLPAQTAEIAPACGLSLKTVRTYEDASLVRGSRREQSF